MFSFFKKKKISEDKEEYYLWVTTKVPEGGYSSRYYGWSSNLKMSYTEALEKKEKLRDEFFDIEIIKL